MANHCVTVSCIFCGTGFCLRCGDECECGKCIGEDTAEKNLKLADGLPKRKWKVYFNYHPRKAPFTPYISDEENRKTIRGLK